MHALPITSTQIVSSATFEQQRPFWCINGAKSFGNLDFEKKTNIEIKRSFDVKYQKRIVIVKANSFKSIYFSK